jgi:hypothetical protein
MSRDDVVEFAAEVPEVSVGTAFGAPALRVRKTFMGRLREDGETPASRCDAEARPFLIEASPGVLRVTPRHRARPMVLLALPHAGEEVVRELVEGARAVRAPKRLVRARPSTVLSNDR